MYVCVCVYYVSVCVGGWIYCSSWASSQGRTEAVIALLMQAGADPQKPPRKAFLPLGSLLGRMLLCGQQVKAVLLWSSYYFLPHKLKLILVVIQVILKVRQR